MSITINRIPEAEFSSWAERQGVDIVVTERDSLRRVGLTRFFASARNVEENGYGVLKSLSGDGDTPEDAIADLSLRMSERPLVFNAYGADRRQLTAPRFVSKEPA